MKKIRKGLFMFPWVFLLLIGTTVFAQQVEHADKTLSPYFFVKSDDPAVDQLPLKSTSAIVTISGVIADVKVTQVYENEGKRSLEAIYVFPASTKAAVYGMTMTIGERIIHAKVQTRDEARREYELAKKQGKSTSLLEQQRPNVFQMNVANILPGDLIRVELRYTELLVPTDRIYEFVYPTVVGPRYSNKPVDSASSSEKWIQNPYLHQGKPPTYSFNIAVDIAAGLPIQDITSPSHEVHIHYDSSSRASVKLDGSEKYGGNRDYILKYRLSGKKIESGLLLYQGEEENFFLMMLQPPKRVDVEQIPPREYIFIVDVSGSMHGFPLDISKKLLKDLIGKLRPTDAFNVLLFAGGSTVLSEHSLPATSEHIRSAVHMIERQRGGGGTNLLPALKRVLTIPKTEGYSRTIIIATDGYVSVEKEAFDLIRSHLGDANMFPFGIGSSVNRYIIEGMARAGMGEPFVITKPEEAPATAEGFRKLIQSPLLNSISVDFAGFDAYDIEPTGIPDVFADRPVIVFGKWRGMPRGKIMVKGITGDGTYTSTIDMGKVKPLESNSALRYLWARYRISVLSDYNRLRPDDERIQEVTNLGLKYNLLTAYTSFVAIDTQVRNKDGELTTVKQPLPLPQGVSDYAVGRGALPSARKLSQKMRYLSSPKEEDKIAEPEIAAKTKEYARLQLGKIVVAGGLSKEEIHGVLEKYLRKIEGGCKKNLWKKGLKGRVFVQLIIRPNGGVKEVNIISSELNRKSVEQCIVQQMKKIHFSPSKEAGKIRVIVSFLVNMK